MIDRTRLLNRRMSTTVEFDYSGVHYTASYSYGSDGKLAEVFLNAGKEGSAADIIGRECSVILSIALQYGTPIEVITESLPKLANGEPAGPVGMVLTKMVHNGN